MNKEKGNPITDIHPDAFLTFVVHGEAKKGKTTLGSTAPSPILFLDAEAGGMRFVPGRKIEWDPQREPVPDVTNVDIVRVSLSSNADLRTVIQIIKSGNHPFKSVVLDSLTEFQSRLRRELGGNLDQQGWGAILDQVNDLVVDLRDAVQEHAPQMQCCLIVTGTEMRDGKYRPMLQGAMKNKLSYKLDGVGFLFTQRDENGQLRRGLRIEGDQLVDAGNRLPTDGEEILWDPNLTTFIQQISAKVIALQGGQ